MTQRSHLAAWFAVPLLLAGSVRAQAPLPPPETRTYHVLTDLIQVPALALRIPFRSVPNLKAADFLLRLDGGPPFHPSSVRIEGLEPVDLSLLVDVGSRNLESLSTALQSASGHWSPNVFPPSDRLSVFLYDCHLMAPLRQHSMDLQQPDPAVTQAFSLSALRSAGAAQPCSRLSLDRVLAAIVDQIPPSANWKVLLLLQNGEHPSQRDALTSVQALAAARGVTLFVIKYVLQGNFPASLYATGEGLNRLAGSLGGITVHSSFQDLEAVIESVIERVRERYILSFPRPSNGTQGPHLLEVTSSARGVHVLSSAVAAPLIDPALCTSEGEAWLCSDQRPQYGTDPRRRLP